MNSLYVSAPHTHPPPPQESRLKKTLLPHPLDFSRALKLVWCCVGGRSVRCGSFPLLKQAHHGCLSGPWPNQTKNQKQRNT